MAGVEGAAAEDVSLKRKRALEDVGEEREQKKVQIEDRRLGIENLHLDVGSKYLLCRTRKAPFSHSRSRCQSSPLGRWADWRLLSSHSSIVLRLGRV